MDADIANATTSLELEKIRTQDNRDRLRAWEAQMQALKAVYETNIGLIQEQIPKLQDPPTPEEKLARDRWCLTMDLAVKYMTTSTATVPESILADAQNDANRLKAAVDAVMALRPA